MFTLSGNLAELNACLAEGETRDYDDLTQRDKMSSESQTEAKFGDLQCHWFPVCGSLMCCTSVGDGDSVWCGTL